MNENAALNRAHQYYALAIAFGLDNLKTGKNEYLLINQIRAGVNQYYSFYTNPTTYILADLGLARQALALLEQKGMIESISDDFGPTAYRITADFQKEFDKWKE